MPGVDLNLDLPLLSDTLATIVAKVTTALSAIEDDLAGKITPSEMDVNGALSMNGSYLTNIGAAQFIGGNPPTAEGSVYYSGGEFFAIDSTGVIQLTAAGSLNAGALGSIVGDYGGSNPARVTYNDATGEYRFTEDVGVWADLVADDLVLESSGGGSVRFGVDAAITTARQFLIKSLPVSGVSFLVYNAATSTVEDGTVTPVTALSVGTLAATTSFTTPTATVGALSATASIALGGAFTRSSLFNLGVDIGLARLVAGTAPTYSSTTHQTHMSLANASDTVIIPVAITPGDRIKQVTIGYTATSFGPSVEVVHDYGHETVSLLPCTSAGSYTEVGGSHVIYQKSTVNSPVALGDGLTASGSVPTGGKASIRIAAGSATTVYHVSVQYDRLVTPSTTIT